MNLADFKNLYRGQRCYILGNGPSLNDIDLGKLEDAITFGTNRIYLKKGFLPTFYVCVNPLVLQQFAADIDELDTVKFLPENAPVKGEFIPLNTTARFPAFSSPEGPLWEGFTVTYVCLQLAYYMGFSEVVLLGVDHYFGQLAGVPNQEQTMEGSDQGHFHPDYFKGTKWNLPDLRMSELAYTLARAGFERAGRQVFNSSHKTALKTFPLVPFNHIVDPWAPTVSAIVSAYKAENYIDGLLADLLGQTLCEQDELEIVAACQYNSIEYNALLTVQRLGARITIVLTEDIPTVYEAWNLCAKEARGKYLTNANTDDRHHPKALEMLADVLDARLDIALTYHDCFITWKANQTFREFIEENEGGQLALGRVPEQPGIFTWPDHDPHILRQGCYIGPQPMWRANLHQTHGYFNPEYQSAGDYDFWLRLVTGGENFYHLPVVLGLYHASTGGIEMSDPERAAREAVTAQGDNMAHGLDIRFVDKEFLRIVVGGECAFVKKDDFLNTFDWIRYGGDPEVEWD